jgi:Transposase DDE domain
MIKRKQIEEPFGWIKTTGGLRKTRHRGRDLVEWFFVLTAVAYNLIPIASACPWRKCVWSDENDAKPCSVPRRRRPDADQLTMLFFVTPEALIQLLERMQYGEHYALYVAPSLIIGLYLTWAGFTASAPK